MKSGDPEETALLRSVLVSHACMPGLGGWERSNIHWQRPTSPQRKTCKPGASREILKVYAHEVCFERRKVLESWGVWGHARKCWKLRSRKCYFPLFSKDISINKCEGKFSSLLSILPICRVFLQQATTQTGGSQYKKRERHPNSVITSSS